MWTLTPSERLRFWYNFRQQLNQVRLDQAIKETTHLWSYAPFVKRYLCINDVKTWPTPWELIYENTYCDIAKSLGMLYTLYLCNHKPKIELRHYLDKDSQENYNLVWIENGKYVLNYEHDDIVNKQHIGKNFQLIKSIVTDDLSLAKIE